MTSRNDLFAFAASRGEGLHPKFRELLERTVSCPSDEPKTRHDGMLQACHSMLKWHMSLDLMEQQADSETWT